MQFFRQESALGGASALSNVCKASCPEYTPSIRGSGQTGYSLVGETHCETLSVHHERRLEYSMNKSPNNMQTENVVPVLCIQDQQTL